MFKIVEAKVHFAPMNSPYLRQGSSGKFGTLPFDAGFTDERPALTLPSVTLGLART